MKRHFKKLYLLSLLTLFSPLVCSFKTAEAERVDKEIKYAEAESPLSLDFNPETVLITLHYFENTNCPLEYQMFLREVSTEMEVPVEVLMTIGDQESGGQWNTNGIVSPTNDYGQFQINACNHSFIKENLGYSLEEILYDPYKNARSAAFLLQEIINTYHRLGISYTYEDLFGTYNGWLQWKSNENALKYVDSAMTIYNSCYANDQTLFVQEDTLEKMKQKVRY